MPSVAPDLLAVFAGKILQAAGVPADESATIAASLVESNLHGHDSHGVYRILEYTAQMDRGEMVPGAPLQILRETPSLIVADGNLGFGQV
ncbi:MAG: Ldh family oxidoreductase, partial [Planctomycetaceae bacterium]|nr:Ldh family oxidoreductase [Planctomycetaceae bacterium]